MCYEVIGPLGILPLVFEHHRQTVDKRENRDIYPDWDICPRSRAVISGVYPDAVGPRLTRR